VWAERAMTQQHQHAGKHRHKPGFSISNSLIWCNCGSVHASSSHVCLVYVYLLCRQHNMTSSSSSSGCSNNTKVIGSHTC
jgi:hypothetical protein